MLNFTEKLKHQAFEVPNGSKVPEFIYGFAHNQSTFAG